MIKEFNENIKNKHLFDQNSKVLLAVSGGIDSMVMASLIIKSGVICSIAHCNFGLRGDESDQDELFVKSFAAKHSIDFYSVRFETNRIANENNKSIQVAARELRYNWFEKLRNEIGFDYIAVAHNSNDNVETILFNLSRGTGITGLTGIKSKNGRVIRPLLFASREMIAEYAELENIAFREDHTNSETKYNRNKIRHLVVPILKEINPALETTIAETGKRLQEIEKYLEEKIDEEKKRYFLYENNRVTIKIDDIKKILSNSSIAYELLKEFGITPSLLTDLKEITDSSSGKQLYTCSHRLIRDRNSICITSKIDEQRNFYTIKDVDGFNDIKFIDAATVTLGKDFRLHHEKEFATLDLSLLKFPLTLRKWGNGDYFFPFGMKGKKKISDYLTDNKYSVIDKENALVLVSGHDIVWLVGERIDNRFGLTTKSSEALVLRVNQH